MSKGWKYGIGLGVVILLLLRAICWWGRFRFRLPMFSVSCSVERGEKASWSFILWESCLPQALTALFCGGALAVCGLMLQTAFKNPLAGPSILGINAGASLEWPRHAVVWRQHHGRCVQSVRLLLRAAWRIYRPC